MSAKQSAATSLFKKRRKHTILRPSNVQEIRGRLKENPGEVLKGDKRACVAVLLRGSPSCTQGLARNSDALDALGALDASDSAVNDLPVDGLEVFFILRATNKQDRWGGQVGLPGGRQEAGETDADTVAREVWEEVGLGVPGLNAARNAEFADVDTRAFKSIGRVKDREILSDLVVTAHVFLQVVAETPPLRLDASEVAAAGWCPLSQFLQEDCAEGIVFDMAHGFLGHDHPWIYSMAKRLSLHEIVFSKVQLDVNPLSVAPHIGLVTVDQSPAQQRQEENRIRQAFFCWGMTLGIINDLTCDQLHLRRRRISLRERIPFFGGQRVDKLFRSPTHNVMLHVLRSAYEKTCGEPMPYTYYITAYPLLVVSSGITAASIVSYKFISKL